MTVFTRNDKVPDPVAGAKPPTTPAMSPEPVRPVYAEAPRPVATHTTMSASIPQAPSVISKALKITGQLESTEDIEIEGEVDGDVRAVSVKVGANAKIKGTVYGDQVELAGAVNGKIEAKKVILTRTAHMSGDVVHQDITIESGAFIDGHCRPEYGKTVSKMPAQKSSAPVREIQPEKANGASVKAAEI